MMALGLGEVRGMRHVDVSQEIASHCEETPPSVLVSLTPRVFQTIQTFRRGGVHLQKQGNKKKLDFFYIFQV